MTHISPSPVTSTFGSVVQPYLPPPLSPPLALHHPACQMLLASQLPVSTAGCGLRPQKLLGRWPYSSEAVVLEGALCHHYAHLILDQTHE